MCRTNSNKHYHIGGQALCILPDWVTLSATGIPGLLVTVRKHNSRSHCWYHVLQGLQGHRKLQLAFLANHSKLSQNADSTTAHKMAISAWGGSGTCLPTNLSRNKKATPSTLTWNRPSCMSNFYTGGKIDTSVWEGKASQREVIGGGECFAGNPKVVVQEVAKLCLYLSASAKDLHLYAGVPTMRCAWERKKKGGLRIREKAEKSIAVLVN